MRRLVLLALGIAACRPGEKAVDSTGTVTTAAVDTVKPDTIGMTTSAMDTTSSKSARPGAVTAGATKQPPRRTTSRDTAHLGRDSVIRTDPRDPRRQLPTVPRKPPQ
jgi:hypothetical protein